MTGLLYEAGLEHALSIIVMSELQPLLVGIDGQGGSGKSTFANELAQALSVSSTIIRGQISVSTLGDASKNYIIRGVEFNDGMVLRELYRLGAVAMGEEKGFHAVAVDARSPRFDGGIATRIDSIPFGVVVNGSGDRFYDEGEDIWPKRYAIWGRKIAEQPDQVAFALWDAKVDRLFLPPMYGSYVSEGISGLAEQLGLDARRLAQTIGAYNASVQSGTFDPTRLDDCATNGVQPPKSHWAQRLDTPPFYGVPLRPGITFTYRGVGVDKTGRIRREGGGVFQNLFAAGEIMSGNILSSGYLAGFGLTIGSVWGRLAGREAACYVR